MDAWNNFWGSFGGGDGAKTKRQLLSDFAKDLGKGEFSSSRDVLQRQVDKILKASIFTNSIR